MRRAGAAVALVAGLLLAAPAAPGHPGHGFVEVGIGMRAYDPPRLEITAGDVVFWHWRGPDTDHTVTGSGPGKTFESDPGVPPENVSHQAGERFAEQFTTPGTYAYMCRKHPEMQGTVVVRADTDGGVAPLDRTRPRLTSVRVVPVRMCRRCARPGGRLRFRLSEAADVEVRITRRRAGRWRTVRRLDVPGRRGGNAVRLSATRLVPGVYRAALRAYDPADNASRVVRRGFVVGYG